jgi:hypothetical protein
VPLDGTGAGAAAASPFPLTLAKTLEANSGDDDAFLGGNLTKSQVLAAPSDIMGNQLLGIHGHPSRSNEPTLEEVKAAVSPIRPSMRGPATAVWTATRESTVDAVFSDAAAFPTAGTPDPQHASKQLPGLRSPNFHREGLLGGDLPILLLNYPVGHSDGAAARLEAAERVAALEDELARAVRAQRYADAAVLQQRAEAARRWAVALEGGGLGGAPPSAANCTYIAGHDWAEGHSSSVAHASGSKEGCCSLCAQNQTCAASVFEPGPDKLSSSCYFKTAADLEAGLVAVPKHIFACVPPGLHPIPAPPPAGHCDNKPRPCPNTHGRTFCPNVHGTDQCASPVRTRGALTALPPLPPRPRLRVGLRDRVCHQPSPCPPCRSPPPPPPRKPLPSDIVLWEEAVVPAAGPGASGNHELNVYIRFMSVNRSAASGQAAPATLYFVSCAAIPDPCRKLPLPNAPRWIVRAEHLHLRALVALRVRRARRLRCAGALLRRHPRQSLRVAADVGGGGADAA